MLDRLDEALELALFRAPSLLLFCLTELAGEQAATGAPRDEGNVEEDEARRLLVLACLRFLSVLLRNCVNKHVFSSAEVPLTICCIRLIHDLVDLHTCSDYSSLFSMKKYTVSEVSLIFHGQRMEAV